MNNISINQHKIGRGCPPFIVAEAGINHNGDLQKALDMIKLAKNSGVDAIKFQTFKADDFIGDPDLTYTYKSQGKDVTESLLELHRKVEFSPEEWRKIKEKCDEEKITFFSTAQNRSDLDLLIELGIPAIKVGSDDFTNLPLLKDYATTGIPLILSSGMATLEEVSDAIDVVGANNGYPTVLLVCTSEYPTPPEDVNLLKFRTLAKEFPNLPLGFSDHTQGPMASSLAVAFGSCLFEKHFTLDRNLPGPDHWFAEDSSTLKIWVESIRQAHIMLGNRNVKPTEKEEKLKNIARRSVITLEDIEEGSLFDKDNLGLKRPGNGLPPKFFEQIIGLRATKKISKGSLIMKGDFK